MSVKIPANRATYRDGVNAAQSFFERHDCVFQEVSQQNDFGKDAYVDVTVNRTVTHLCIALQIKAGSSYRTPDGDYFVPVAQHGANWRRSTVPVFGLVFDPEDRGLRWRDLTGYLRDHPHQEGGVIPVARHALLTAESLRGAFMRAVEAYAPDAVGAVASGLLSDADGIQLDAVFDAWALGRHDARYLVLLRRLLLELRTPSVRRAIVALSYATPHPDIFWTKDNWIPPATKRRAAESFRWSPRELAHMLAAIAEDDWGRGQLAQSLDMLIREDPDSAAVLEWSIDMLLGSGDVHSASSAAMLLLASSEHPRKMLAALRLKHPELIKDSWFREIAGTVETWGGVSLD